MGTPRHIAIPVAVERENIALEYAILTIRRHTTLEPVTIGHDLGVCDHIHLDQLPGLSNARVNTNNAMRTACETFPNGFVWSNDDIYWLKPADPIMWALGELDTTPTDILNGRRRRATAETLRRMGLPTFDYEAHVPLPVVNVPAMLEALDIVAQNPTMLEKRSVYGNMTATIPDRIAPDVKLRNPTNRHRDVEWASTLGNPEQYPHLIGRLTASTPSA